MKCCALPCRVRRNMCHPKHDLAHPNHSPHFLQSFSTLPPSISYGSYFYSYYAILPSFLKVFVTMLKENLTSTSLRPTVIMWPTSLSTRCYFEVI